MPLIQEPEQVAFLSLLERVCNLTTSTLDGQSFFNQLLDELIAGLDIDACWIHLFNSEIEELEIIAHRGFNKQLIKEMGSLSLGQGLSGKVALLKEPLISPTLYPDEEHAQATPVKTSLRCFIAAPMISRNNIFGVIGLGSTNANSFTVHDLKMLSIIGSSIAVANDRSYLLYSKGEFERAERFSALSQEQEFMNALSHELQTPLTALIASVGLLIDELQKEPKGPQLRLAHNIAHSASSLQNRLMELIELSRSKTARFSIKMETFDFSTLAYKVVEELSPLINSKEQSLTIEVPDSISVTADKQRLEQILLNLVSNAGKFTPQGGQIILRARRNKQDLIVEVQDTGQGIPEDEQAKLFRPYYRTPADRYRVPGLGLGLAITKQLVKLHRGRIWMESKLGKGSTFAFSIPLTSK